ncbi:SCO family protein [Sinobacterium norvegicum]|nr:SCO family protein [Sinobacterium norvegicum]
MAAMNGGVKKTILAVVCFILLILALLVNKILSPRIMNSAELRANGAVVLQKPRHFEMDTLVDQYGNPFDAKRFEGQWTMVFFGYTYCPDICPTTLAMLTKFKGLIADERFSDNLQVVLVSVDPARDTPEKLKPYMAYFDEEFVGITGEFFSVHRFASSLNAAFNKRMISPNPDEYLVDHSGNIALINPRGDYHAFFLPPFDPGKLRLLYRSIRGDYDQRYDS